MKASLIVSSLYQTQTNKFHVILISSNQSGRELAWSEQSSRLRHCCLTSVSVLQSYSPCIQQSISPLFVCSWYFLYFFVSLYFWNFCILLFSSDLCLCLPYFFSVYLFCALPFLFWLCQQRGSKSSDDRQTTSKPNTILCLLLCLGRSMSFWYFNFSFETLFNFEQKHLGESAPHLLNV